MNDAHLEVGQWMNIGPIVTNDHGEMYRQQSNWRQSIYCGVKTVVKFYRWVRVAH